MIAVIQRVSRAQVRVSEVVISSVKHGYLILLGIMEDDTAQDSKELINKIIHLRIMEDENGRMNKSIIDSHGEILVVSQFTLCGDISKGRRPSFIKAMKPDLAESMYLEFVQTLKNDISTVATGKFGAEMEVELVNDGPVTIYLDSRSFK